MKFQFSVLTILVLGFSPAVWADHWERADSVEQERVDLHAEIPVERKQISIEENEVGVDVLGIVCSFCAYGVEKKMSRLDFVDTNRFSDGVFTDIKSQQLKVAIRPRQKVNLQAIKKAIKQAGYELVAVHLRLSGVVQDQQLSDARFDRRFLIRGEIQIAEGKPVDLQGHVSAEEIDALERGEPIPFSLDRLVFAF